MRCWHLESQLENLKETDYDQVRVSPPTPGPIGYNCIAFAAGETNRRWWPSKTRKFYYFWPPHLPREEHLRESLENFVLAFEWIGYRRCKSPRLEKGIEKVAVFVGANENPLHAARQLDSGMWVSKCGDAEDIEHRTLASVEGNLYGKAKAFLKRRRDGKPFLADRILSILKMPFRSVTPPVGKGSVMGRSS